MFRKHHQGRRSPNIVFVIFRLILSGVMLVILLAGLYAAYKNFSGLDPLKLDPLAVFNNVIVSKMPPEASAFFTKLNPAKAKTGQDAAGAEHGTSSPKVSLQPEAKPALRFLLVADSHGDNNNLNKAIAQGKAKYPDLEFIIGLGDYTEVGTVEELKNAKKEFDAAALRYFLIPGDHDLWDCRNRSLPATDCFTSVFGPAYQSFEFGNFLFLLLDNSDNYKGFDEKQTNWIASELEKYTNNETKGLFIFTHEPLYHPSSDHVMGRVEKNLKLQANALIFQLNDAGATRVFAGDNHFFSEYSEPKTNLEMVTIGAAAIERNPQAPRFAVVSVFGNGEAKVEDVEIK